MEQHADDRGLTRSIWADQSKYLPLLEAQRDILDYRRTTKGLRQAGCPQYLGHRELSFLLEALTSLPGRVFDQGGVHVASM